jgi:hypothetical protein
MIERPTEGWRESVAAEADQITAGPLDPDDAGAVSLFPEDMLADTDAVLSRFEQDAEELVAPRWVPANDEEIFQVVERTVRALNAVNARHGGAAYETGEREQLCAYIEAVLDAAGIDVDELAGRHRMTRHEITDEWRQW